MNELVRQSLHFLFGLLMCVILLVFGKIMLFIFAFFCLALAVIASFFAAKKILPPPFSKVLELAQRRKEEELPFAGAMFFLLGTMALAIFFPEKAVLGGLLVLSIGDAASTLFGKKFGRTKITDRHTLEGSIAGAAASIVGLLVFFTPTQAIFGAIFGMLSELLSLEDNFTIPIAAGLAITLLL